LIRSPPAFGGITLLSFIFLLLEKYCYKTRYLLDSALIPPSAVLTSLLLFFIV